MKLFWIHPESKSESKWHRWLSPQFDRILYIAESELLQPIVHMPFVGNFQTRNLILNLTWSYYCTLLNICKRAKGFKAECYATIKIFAEFFSFEGAMLEKGLKIRPFSKMSKLKYFPKILSEVNSANLCLP